MTNANLKPNPMVIASTAARAGNLVAQIFNLPYRRFSSCRRCARFERTANSKSAIRHSTNLRYKRNHVAPALLAGLFLVVVAAGWPLSVAAETLLLRGATVHTVSGEALATGQVLIRDGKIVAVGKTVAADGATAVELAGQHLYPGLIALNTVLGLTEISGVRATQDTTEVGDEFTPDVESWVSVNPDSELIPVTRANGIAYFEPMPEGHIVSGQSALLATAGWTWEQMSVKKPIALHLFWPDMDLDTTPKEKARDKSKWKSLAEQAEKRRARIWATEDFFEEARAYAKAKDAATKGQATAPQLVPAWEAMLPYVRGELPVIVHADEVRQIRTAIGWAETNHIKLILASARDAWAVAGLLAEKHVPVVYGHTYTRPPRDTASYDVQFRAPAVLHEAGVQVTFSMGADSFDAALIKNLPYSAAQAVAFGLPEAEALKGLTLYPAQLAGVGDRLGSIEPGKEATLFTADGDILDIRATVKRMWIAGQEVSLENRHTRLYEKYQNRPRSQ